MVYRKKGCEIPLAFFHDVYGSVTYRQVSRVEVAVLFNFFCFDP
jgi:hypothetical protein